MSALSSSPNLTAPWQARVFSTYCSDGGSAHCVVAVRPGQVVLAGELHQTAASQACTVHMTIRPYWNENLHRPSARVERWINRSRMYSSTSIGSTENIALQSAERRGLSDSGRRAAHDAAAHAQEGPPTSA